MFQKSVEFRNDLFRAALFFAFRIYGKNRFVQTHSHKQPSGAVIFIEIQPYSLVIFRCGSNVRFFRRMRFEFFDQFRAQRLEIATRLKTKSQFRRFDGHFQIRDQIREFLSVFRRFCKRD